MIYRPLWPRLRLTHGPRAILAVALVALATLAGCTNPSFIGVQDYGTIYGNVVDAAGKPIAGALVSATGTQSTYNSVGNGSFRLSQVAIGTQTVHISAPGYTSPATDVSVLVVKNGETPAGNITLTSTSAATH